MTGNQVYLAEYETGRYTEHISVHETVVGAFNRLSEVASVPPEVASVDDMGTIPKDALDAHVGEKRIQSWVTGNAVKRQHTISITALEVEA